jgi:NADH-quinone oxidoreductase E subunit
MSQTFSSESQQRIEKILSRYPNKMAACLPLLYVAQEELGHLSKEAMDLVAETLELPLSHVYGVATFYTMFNKEPVGRYHIQACTNVSCMLCDGYQVLARLEQKLGIKPGETTKDGLFTLNEVECLAYCGTAPAVQINDDIHELVSPDKVDDLIDELKAR